MKKCNKLSLLLIFTTICLVIIYAFLISSKWQGYDYDEIRKKGVIRIVVEKNTMSFTVTEDSTLIGLQYKMVKQLAKDWDIEVFFADASDLGTAIEMLNNNEVDVLVWHIPVHVEMEDNLAFTIPVFTSRQVLVQRNTVKNNIIRNQLDLAKKTIHIPKDSPFKQRILNLSKEIGDTVFIQELGAISLDSIFSKIAAGEIDYSVCEEIAAKIEKKQFPTLDTGTPIGFTQNYAWGTRHSAIALRDSLNKWLSEYLDSPEYNRIYIKYTGIK